MEISRREFLKTGIMGAAGLFASGLDLLPGKKDAPLREAMFYRSGPDRRVECLLCPRFCLIPPGGRGNCGARENRGGKLYSLNYARICSLHLDPIEKKPFYHFLPGSQSLSFAGAGCNLHCRFCQNWEISQSAPDRVGFQLLSPGEMAKKARELGAKSLAGTYSEPTVFYEYLLETAKAARAYKLPTVMVSSGFINPEPLELLCRHLKAVKIDFKSFSEAFYRDYCSGRLEPVLNAMKTVKKAGVWLEIVNLAIPTLNDREKDFAALCGWIKQNLGKKVPLHFTCFYPMYRLKNLPPTSPQTVIRAREIAREKGLEFVYTGNLPNDPGENTYCPRCQKPVLTRQGWLLTGNDLLQGKCRFCGEVIPGYWKQEG